MTLRNPIYPKVLLLSFVCAIQPVFGGQGGSTPASQAAAAGSETSVAASIATNPAAASPVTTPPLPAATAQPAEAAGQAVAEAAAAVQVVEPGAPAAKAEAAAVTSTVFPKIAPRWRKWELGVIESHARKNNWQALPSDSVRIVPYNSLGWGTGFQVNLKTGDVTVLAAPEDTPKIRSFKLQSPELDDLRRLLEGKPFADLAAENQTIGKDGASLLIEADWKGEYRWRLYRVDMPHPLPEIQALVQKAYVREQQRKG